MCFYFSSGRKLFKFHVPEYETIVFGGKIGELRLVKQEISIDKSEIFPLNTLKHYLISNDIIACTFRGKEDIHIIQALIKLGFDFIATYNSIEVDEKSFKKINISTNLEVSKAELNEFEEILNDNQTETHFQVEQIHYPGELYKEACKHRTNRYSPFGSVVSRTSVKFAWAGISFGEIRDLNRHRTGTKYCPLLPIGFYGSTDQFPKI